MTIHPAHALLLANVRHRELVEDAEEYRRARHAGQGDPPGRSGPACRTPTPAEPAAGRAHCHPDPRPTRHHRSGAHRATGRWTHWTRRGRQSWSVGALLAHAHLRDRRRRTRPGR